MTELSNLIASAQTAPAFFDKATKKGTAIRGQIVALSVRQSRDPATNKAESWDDGSPKQQIVIILNNTNVAGLDPDDKRTVYVKWWGENRKSFATACEDAKIGEPKPGDYITVAYEGEGPKPENPALSPTKFYSYVIEPTI